jgi:hypothetical protein
LYMSEALYGNSGILVCICRAEVVLSGGYERVTED